jgi:hypothetical protein
MPEHVGMCLEAKPRLSPSSLLAAAYRQPAYPIIGQIERAAKLVHNDKPHAKLDKLDALLAGTSTSTQEAALFAEMLSLPNDGRYPTLDLAPEQRRQRTLVFFLGSQGRG